MTEMQPVKTGARFVGVITARGGSKVIPGKNIRPMAGKPMIAWTIEAALRSKGLDRVIVSTDDAAIAHVSRQCGAEVPFLRPAELAGDTSSHISVIEHALGWLAGCDGRPPEYLLLLQPTSPLRTAEDIEAIIAVAANRGARAVISVCEPSHHPFGLKKITPEGTLADFMPSGLAYARRQDFPPVFAVNGALYLCQSSVILQEHTLEPPDALPYIMPVERSLDVDTLWDFELAEMILERRQGTAR